MILMKSTLTFEVIHLREYHIQITTKDELCALEEYTHLNYRAVFFILM